MPDGTIRTAGTTRNGAKSSTATSRPLTGWSAARASPARLRRRQAYLHRLEVQTHQRCGAWGFLASLADDKGELHENAFEKAHPESWKEAPPLWSCSTVAEYTWPFAYIDEQDVDTCTRDTHKGYLEITRDLGQGRYEITGYSSTAAASPASSMSPIPASSSSVTASKAASSSGTWATPKVEATHGSCSPPMKCAMTPMASPMPCSTASADRGVGLRPRERQSHLEVQCERSNSPALRSRSSISRPPKPRPLSWRRPRPGRPQTWPLVPRPHRQKRPHHPPHPHLHRPVRNGHDLHHGRSEGIPCPGNQR